MTPGDIEALIEELRSNNVHAIEARLDAGLDPNLAVPVPDVNDGISILYFACDAGAVDTARLLLERGATPDDGESVYHAAQRYHPACLELLVEFGANLSGAHESFGNTPLYFLASHTAANSLAPTVVQGMRWLLEHGADPNVFSRPQQPESQREAPLMRAAASGFGADVLAMFVAHGADLEATRDDGRTAYALAVCTGNEAGATYLAAAGASSAVLTPRDRLLGACATANAERARAIAATDASIVQQLALDDRRALVRAVGENQGESVRLMLELGWPLDTESEWGGTPLHWAAWHGRPALAAMLVQHGAPLDQRDTRYGSSPIAWAAHGSQFCERANDADYVAVVTILLDAGVSRVASFNSWNEAPESLARPAVAALLVARGFAPPPAG
jgi:ankyrin repeat protein